MPSSAPAWLFTGPEIGERNAAIEQLKNSALKASGELDFHSLYAGDDRIGEVVSLLQNGSLFASARFVVLRNAELIKKKEDVSMLVDWISASAGVSDAYLVLVSDEIGIDRKIEAAVDKERKRIFWELFENRKEQWIGEFFRKEGLRIEPEAIASILDLVENNTDALRTACSRLALFFEPGYCITEEDIVKYLEHNREESPFSLFDSLVEGDLEDAVEILRKLALSRDSSPVQTVAGLSYCFRRLADWHRLAESGINDEFSLKKAGFTSKKAVAQYRAAARRWDSSAAERILARLASSDFELRSSGTALHQPIIELCLYSIVRLGGEVPASADYS